MSKRTLIVILNYRTADLTIECLQSLENEISPTQDIVIVVDNKSNDDSPEKINHAIKIRGWSHWAKLMALEENRGYAAGNNAAIREVFKEKNFPKYTWVLNPDTLALKGSLDSLIDFIENHPKAAIVGSRLVNRDGSYQSSAFRFPTVLSELDQGLRLGFITHFLSKWNIVHQEKHFPFQVDWVSGASFMIRNELIKQIGLFDENYFLYYEELDFCFRAFQSGWECWSVPQSQIIHLGGQSTGISPSNYNKRLPKYWFESRRRFFFKNYGYFHTLLIDTTWMSSFILWRIRRILQRKPECDPPHLLWDFFKHSAFFP